MASSANPLENFLLIDQLKIMGYGESDTSGCWIKFQLTPELLEVVRGRKGEMVEVAARLIDNSGEYVPAHIPDPEKPSEHGKYWQTLIRKGVFNAPDILKAIGTDDDYQEWVRKQPSCLSKESDWVEDIGEGRCEYAHVRRVSEGSGTGIKPDYFGVPMTHKEHLIQHNNGEAETLFRYQLGSHSRNAIEQAGNERLAHEWFEKKAAHYRKEWASTTLVKTLGYERRRDCPPEAVQEWVSEHGLERYFPRDRMGI